MNGTYSFVYSGELGVGIGVFHIVDSQFVGASLAGGSYKGRAVVDEETGEIELSLNMEVPAGVSLVQGTGPQEMTYTKAVGIKAPANFGDGKPFEIYIAPGPVTLMVKRIPDDWAPLAYGMTVQILPTAAA